MKYIYRQTGCIVESNSSLDSSMFAPLVEEVQEKKEPAKKAVKRAPSRTKRKEES